jgi:photosystem II stability/assembly factor-like uncharacterized protein
MLAPLLRIAALVATATASPPDEGAWSPFGLDDLDVTYLLATTDRLYACAFDPPVARGRGLYARELDESGSAWRHVGLDGIGLSSVWVHPGDDELLLATVLLPGADGAAVLRSTDGGRSWERADEGLDAERVWSIVGERSSEPALLVTTSSGVHRSTDLGDSWRLVDRCPPDVMTRDSAFVPRRGGHVVTSRTVTYGAAVRAVADDGRPRGTWSSDRSNANLVRAVPASGRIYATVGEAIGGLVTSGDGGRSWEPIVIDPGHEFFALAVAPWDARTIVTAKLWSRDPVRVTRDGGRTWRPLCNGLGGGEHIVLALEPDREREGVFYLARGIRGAGVARIRLAGPTPGHATERVHGDGPANARDRLW